MTATSNDRHGVSNYRSIECLFNSLLRLTTRNIKGPRHCLFVRGIHRWPVDSPHKGSVTRKMLPFDDVIMKTTANHHQMRMVCLIFRKYCVSATAYVGTLRHNMICGNGYTRRFLESFSQFTAILVIRGASGNNMRSGCLCKHRQLQRTYTGFTMTSSNGNIFCVSGHLCGEFTGPRWIPLTKACDAELWCFLWSASESTVD